ncbi:MAG TPA: PD-(D/E)XK nuclease family protein [Steroidobacteraceae bacterium]|nr:PD-(D/E)XK nuclease family protein [Steroidobacteraceae bacterium]
MRIPPELSAALAAGRTVLAPNTELAAALFDAAEREQRALGLALWVTPRVRDFGSWLREQQERAHLEDAKVPRPIADIEERELWRQVIENSLFSQNLLEVGVAARAARRARRLMLDYAIPWNRVLEEATDEVQAFYAWHREFEARCRSLGLSPPAPLPPSLKSGEKLSWIDNPAWRPVVRQWLTRHAQRISPKAETAGGGRALHFDSGEAEFAHLARSVRERLEADREFRAWVCIPDLARWRSEVAAAFDAELAPGRFTLSSAVPLAAYALAGGTPLAQHASVRAVLDFLDAANGSVSFVKFSALLRAPWLQESEDDAVAAAILERELRERGPYEATLAGWLKICDEFRRFKSLPPLAAAVHLSRALATLEASVSAKRLSEWIPLWLEAFKLGPWVLRRRWSSVEFQAAERFRDLVSALARADGFFGTQSRTAAARLLKRAVGEVSFQAQTGVPPVWVSGQLLDPFLNYQAIFVCGMSSVQWPPPPEAAALLPVRLQREYGVLESDSVTQRANAEALQHAWKQRAPLCVFSFSDSIDGRRAQVSALLAESAADVAAPVVRPHWRSVDAAPVLEECIDHQAPPFDATQERTHGIATLRAQSRCAFRGFAESRLAAQQLELPVPGFNQRERGELVHAALEHVWSELKDHAALMRLEAGAEEQLLKEAARRAITTVCRRRDPGERWRVREQPRLEHLLGKWLAVERERSPFRVELLEGGGQVVTFGGLPFRVRIDRQDELEDGARVVIDYKTGAATADWRGERPDNPQLPVYALLRPERLVAVAYGRVNAAESRFVAESERGNVFKAGDKPQPRKGAMEGEPSFAALIERWRTRIEAIASRFAAGDAAVAPTATACQNCPLPGLCRIQSLSGGESSDE